MGWSVVNMMLHPGQMKMMTAGRGGEAGFRFVCHQGRQYVSLLFVTVTKSLTHRCQKWAYCCFQSAILSNACTYRLVACIVHSAISPALEPSIVSMHLYKGYDALHHKYCRR